MNRRWYTWHRYLAALAFLQLLVWSLSGLVFALLSERSVMSARAPAAHDRPLLLTDEGTSAWAILRQLPEPLRASVHRLELRASDAGPVWIVRGDELRMRLDAQTGLERPVGAEEAGRIASRDQEGNPAVGTLDRFEAGPPIEYRERPLPAWRVCLRDADETCVWVDALTGEVTARRTDAWRTHDFLWSLHTMDWTERDDFRTPWLIGFALLANLTALSGIVLWTLRVVRRWRRRARRTAPGD